jgi:predicted RNA-binding protein YlxR (DUF448 family)
MERTCVGCRVATTSSELARLVLGPDGTLVADARGGASGRGAWVHPNVECVARGVPRGVARALKTEVKTTPEEVLAQLRAQGMRRVLALVGSAQRARKAAAGGTAASEALARGEVALVVVASDARAAAELAPIAAAVARGQGIVVGTKAELGIALGRPDTGVVAILDAGIGASLRQAAALSELPSIARPAHQSKEAFVTETG